MAYRQSTGLVNRLMDSASFRDLFANGAIDIYSGVQPTLPDNVPSGTLLATITRGGGAYTAETRGVGSLAIAGAAGSVDTVTVNGIDILGGSVAFATDINATATAVAAQINRNPKNQLFTASTTGLSGVITITANIGLGALVNTWAVSGTYTTITGGTYVAMIGGVDAVNGLRFDYPAAAGVLSKPAGDTWKTDSALAGGTAGWFRMREATDAGTTLSTTACRIDGAISTSGAEMNLGSLTVTALAPFVLTGGSFTMPQ